MPIFVLIMIYGALIFAILGTINEYSYDNYPPKVLALLLSVVIVWNCFSYHFYTPTYVFKKSYPVKFEEHSAYIYIENDFVNLSKELKVQFKIGDTIYLYNEVSQTIAFLKYSVETNYYQTKKQPPNED